MLWFVVLSFCFVSAVGFVFGEDEVVCFEDEEALEEENCSKLQIF